MTAPFPDPSAENGFWCEAYGPPPEEYRGSEDEWPRCFFVRILGFKCVNYVRCAAAMTAERQRVHRRIQEMAAAGDEAAGYLAEQFTSPEQILNADEGDTR